MSTTTVIDSLTLAGGTYRDVTLEQDSYTDGTTALQLLSNTGSPIATVTVNLAGAGYLPRPGAFFVKNYAENTGIAEELQRLGIITPTGNSARLTFDTVSEYTLA